MPRVHLPALLRPLAGDTSSVLVEASTVRGVIDALDRRFPGMGDRLIEKGAIRPEIIIAIAGDETRDLSAAVAADADVHILPAIAGG